jgi:hypothetical protein
MAYETSHLALCRRLTQIDWVEVAKLLNFRSIGEVLHIEWLANPVMVVKRNGKMENVSHLHQPQQGMP